MEKKLGQYQKVLTDDGSTTYFSEYFQEACHSTSGAMAETDLHYIKGCQIESKLDTDETISVLEVGFGTGIGYLQTKKLADSKQKLIYFYSFELDQHLVELFANQYKLNFTQEKNVFILKDSWIHLHIYVGNARETIKKLQAGPQKFQAIYQDAFSPKKNSELWTTEWFKDLKTIAHETCIMSTYSSSSSIRKSMLAAGWKLYKGDKFGPKRSSTRARLTGKTDQDILAQLGRSPAPEITDQNFKSYTLDNK